MDNLFDFLGYYRAWALALYGVAFVCFMKGLNEVLYIIETLSSWWSRAMEWGGK